MKKLFAILLASVLCLTASAFCTAEGAGYTEEVVSIDAGDHQIPATVCIPEGEGPFPAVVMLHGTGSTRDEAGNGYAMAAPVMAAEYGVATVRIDFCGYGDSTADPTMYDFENAVADAVAAAEYMASLDVIDGNKIGVMGWSQGGTDALLSAGKHPEIFKSIVTWAGAPDLSDMLTDDLYADAQQNGYFVMEFDFRDPVNVSLQWCEDVRNVDVLDVFSAYEGPVLAIAGTADTTVDPEWSNKIVAANSNEASATYFIEGMDHTFNVFSGDLTAVYDAIAATGSYFAETLA